MKFIALLRGINVGGNNKVSMPELKKCFEELGFENVITYINSGNVIFETSIQEKIELIRRCEVAIEKQFNFHVVCCVISVDELREALLYSPDWWGLNDGNKHNAIFVIPPATADIIMNEVGEVKPEYEKVAAHGSVIFWTAPLKTFSRTRYSKIVGTKAYQSTTIRNSNTTKKLVELGK